jgi:hypothetical protein
VTIPASENGGEGDAAAVTALRADGLHAGSSPFAVSPALRACCARRCALSQPLGQSAAANALQAKVRNPARVTRTVGASQYSIHAPPDKTAGNFRQGARDFHSRDRCGVPTRLVPGRAEFELSVPTIPIRARSIPVRSFASMLRV